jgi:hypothetical protein
MTADDNRMPLTFVVGSGRCGSTMMSRILSEHPDVLSISEIMSADQDRRFMFTLPSIDGPGVWERLSTPQPLIDSFFSSGLVRELCYPRDGRFKPDTGIPPICHSVLPMLSNDPDALFDVLAAEVPTWPLRSLTDQFRALFGFLGQHLGKRVTVERSGGSIARMQMLREEFPEARFVHIHRNGPDCAVSMSRHLTIRMTVLQVMLDRIQGPQVMLDRIQGPQAGNEGVPEEFRTLVTHPVDIERLRSFPIPLTFFGELWSLIIGRGLTALAGLPPDRWTSMRYEQVLTDPAAELTRLADFIGVPATPQWLATATAQISRTGPANISAELPPDALAAVQRACAPGTEALAAAESHLLEATGHSRVGANPGGKS